MAVGRMTVGLDVTTVDFVRGMREADESVKKFMLSAGGSSKGLNAMEVGLRRLGFEAIGLKGPLGKVAEGLAMFGGGSLLVLGVAAGLGAIGLAMKLMGAEAEATQKQIESLSKTARSGFFGAESARPGLESRKAEIERQLKQQQRRGPGFSDPRSWIEFVPEITGKKRQTLLTELAGINSTLRSVDVAAQDAASTMIAGFGGAAAKIIETRDAIRKARLEFAASGAGVGGSLMGSVDYTAGGQFLRNNSRLNAGDTSRFGDIKNQTAADLFRMRSDAEDSRIAGTVGKLNQLSGAIQLLGFAAGSSGTRLGMLLGGAGGVVGTANPLAGALLGLGGAVVDALFGRHDPLPVHDEAVADMLKKQRSGPDKVSINILSHTGDVRTVEVDLRRRTRLDGRSRVPYGVPAEAA